MFDLQFLCEMIQPLFHQFKCIDLLNDEFKRRAMYYTPSPGCAPAEYDDAADSDENVLFCVMTDYDDCGGDAVGERIKFIVERYDDSLNKFTTHFTSPWINTLHFGHILYENKIFVIGGCEFGLSTNAVSEKMNRHFIHLLIEASKYSRSFADDSNRYEDWRNGTIASDE